MSVPSAPEHWPVATATALPPELPPAVVPLGVCTAPKEEWSEWDPMPNSSRLVLPAKVAPAERSWVTTVALKGEVKFLRPADAHVVGRARVQMLSFMAMCWPVRGPSLEAVGLGWVVGLGREMKALRCFRVCCFAT